MAWHSLKLGDVTDHGTVRAHDALEEFDFSFAQSVKTGRRARRGGIRPGSFRASFIRRSKYLRRVARYAYRVSSASDQIPREPPRHQAIF